MYSFLKVVRIHQHATFQANSCMRSAGNAPTPLRTDRPKKATVGRMDHRTHVPVSQWKEVISGFGRTDGQSENIVPPVPKGGGINMYYIKHIFTRVEYGGMLPRLRLICQASIVFGLRPQVKNVPIFCTDIDLYTCSTTLEVFVKTQPYINYFLNMTKNNNNSPTPLPHFSDVT